MRILDVIKNPIGQPLSYAMVHFVAVVPDPAKAVPLQEGNAEVLPCSSVDVVLDESAQLDCVLARATYRVYLTQREIRIQQHIGYIKESVFDANLSNVRLAAIISKEPV